MKKLLLIVFVGFIFSGCIAGPEIPKEKRKYQKILKFPDNKSDLYEKSKIWLAREFKSSKAVIQYDNKENGTIVGKGMIFGAIYGLIPVYTQFTLEINVKKNKSRLTFNDFINKGERGLSTYSMKTQKHIDTFKPYMVEMIQSYQNFVKNNKNDEW